MKSKTVKATPVVVEPLETFACRFTPSEREILEDARARCASDLGRGISGSAILRALLRLCKKDVVGIENVSEEILAEQFGGRVWGKRPLKGLTPLDTKGQEIRE